MDLVAKIAREVIDLLERKCEPLSKRQYKDVLEEVDDLVKARIDCVNEELEQEETS